MTPSTVIPTNHPFRPDSALNRARSQGHLNRHGHRLTGHWTTINGLAHLTLTCCTN